LVLLDKDVHLVLFAVIDELYDHCKVRCVTYDVYWLW